MNTFFYIDGGTTNTRIYTVKDGFVIEKRSLGVGASLSKTDRAAYEQAISLGLADAEKSLCPEKAEGIVASGMITSELGLCPLPHMVAPVSLADLAAGMERVSLPHISSLPFSFVRGVKCDSGNLVGTDMMRGEETEIMGLSHYGDGLYLLPGSHNKLIALQEGKITEFSTTLSGEMIFALAHATILKDAVDLSLTETVPSALVEGCAYALEKGMGEALFKTRVYKNLFHADERSCYSFFLGVVLSSEVLTVKNAPQKRVILGGKSAIKHALATLLSRLTAKEIIVADDEESEYAATRGAILLARLG